MWIIVIQKFDGSGDIAYLKNLNAFPNGSPKPLLTGNEDKAMVLTRDDVLYEIFDIVNQFVLEECGGSMFVSSRELPIFKAAKKAAADIV